MVRSPDGDTEILQGDCKWLPICLDYILWSAIDPLNEYRYTLKKRRSKRFPASLITDTDYANDLATKLLDALVQVASGIESMQRRRGILTYQLSRRNSHYIGSCS